MADIPTIEAQQDSTEDYAFVNQVQEDTFLVVSKYSNTQSARNADLLDIENKNGLIACGLEENAFCIFSTACFHEMFGQIRSTEVKLIDRLKQHEKNAVLVKELGEKPLLIKFNPDPNEQQVLIMCCTRNMVSVFKLSISTMSNDAKLSDAIFTKYGTNGIKEACWIDNNSLLVLEDGKAISCNITSNTETILDNNITNVSSYKSGKIALSSGKTLIIIEKNGNDYNEKIKYEFKGDIHQIYWIDDRRLICAVVMSENEECADLKIQPHIVNIDASNGIKSIVVLPIEYEIVDLEGNKIDLRLYFAYDNNMKVLICAGSSDSTVNFAVNTEDDSWIFYEIADDKMEIRLPLIEDQETFPFGLVFDYTFDEKVQVEAFNMYQEYQKSLIVVVVTTYGALLPYLFVQRQPKEHPRVHKTKKLCFLEESKPPVEQRVKSPAEQTLKLPLNQTIKSTFEQAFMPPVEQTFDTPFGQTAKPPFGQTIKLPAEQTLKPPLNQTIKSTFEQAFMPPVEQTFDTPFGQTAKTLFGQTIKSPAEQKLKSSFAEHKSKSLVELSLRSQSTQQNEPGRIVSTEINKILNRCAEMRDNIKTLKENLRYNIQNVSRQMEKSDLNFKLDKLLSEINFDLNAYVEKINSAIQNFSNLWFAIKYMKENNEEIERELDPEKQELRENILRKFYYLETQIAELQKIINERKRKKQGMKEGALPTLETLKRTMLIERKAAEEKYEKIKEYEEKINSITNDATSIKYKLNLGKSPSFLLRTNNNDRNSNIFPAEAKDLLKKSLLQTKGVIKVEQKPLGKVTDKSIMTEYAPYVQKYDKEGSETKQLKSKESLHTLYPVYSQTTSISNIDRPKPSVKSLDAVGISSFVNLKGRFLERGTASKSAPITTKSKAQSKEEKESITTFTARPKTEESAELTKTFDTEILYNFAATESFNNSSTNVMGSKFLDGGKSESTLSDSSISMLLNRSRSSFSTNLSPFIGETKETLNEDAVLSKKEEKTPTFTSLSTKPKIEEPEEPTKSFNEPKTSSIESSGAFTFSSANSIETKPSDTNSSNSIFSSNFGLVPSSNNESSSSTPFSSFSFPVKSGAADTKETVASTFNFSDIGNKLQESMEFEADSTVTKTEVNSLTQYSLSQQAPDIGNQFLSNTSSQSSFSGTLFGTLQRSSSVDNSSELTFGSFGGFSTQLNQQPETNTSSFFQSIENKNFFGDANSFPTSSWGNDANDDKSIDAVLGTSGAFSQYSNAPTSGGSVFSSFSSSSGGSAFSGFGTSNTNTQ
jgi:hypothetical protein